MFEFFKGWRRKIGVMTLGLACMIMAVWVRSFSTKDVFTGTTTIANQSSLKDKPTCVQRFVITANGSVEFIFWNSTHKIGEQNAGSHRELLPVESSFCEPKVIESQHGLFGIQIKTGKIFPWCQATVYVIPFSMVVIPLAAISAYLLLKKPKISTQNKILALPAMGE